LAGRTLTSWYKSFRKKLGKKHYSNRKVYFFADEFTNYNDVMIGRKAIRLLLKLGYEVEIPDHTESGRTFLSKGLLDDAKMIANNNISTLGGLVSEEIPLIGVEPSAVLTLRDEYLDLAEESNRNLAENLATHTYLIEEFIASEIDKGHITKDQFTQEKRLIKVHGHCHQKALSTMVAPKKMLSLPENYEVHMIASGCCGMAGSFGYEKEHYDVSMKIGELVLFPTVRKQPADVIIAAAGTSCRHQIKDGTDRTALHPVEILLDALN
jgi:Fe-S oxidoreductase